jgi:hypothetical protein
MTLTAVISLFATLITSPDECMYSIDGARPPDLPGETVVVAEEGPNHRRFVSILTTGEFLDLQYAGCLHFGVTATIMLPISTMVKTVDVDEHFAQVEARLIRLGRMVLHPEDVGILRSSLSRSPYNGGLVAQVIPHKYYAYYYYKIEETENYYLTTIVFWHS